jgi:hypothetical protein
MRLNLPDNWCGVSVNGLSDLQVDNSVACFRDHRALYERRSRHGFCGGTASASWILC